MAANLREHATWRQEGVPRGGKRAYSCGYQPSRDKAAELLRLLRTNYTLAPFDIMREYAHYNFGMYITHLGSMLSTL